MENDELKSETTGDTPEIPVIRAVPRRRYIGPVYKDPGYLLVGGRKHRPRDLTDEEIDKLLKEDPALARWWTVEDIE